MKTVMLMLGGALAGAIALYAVVWSTGSFDEDAPMKPTEETLEGLRERLDQLERAWQGEDAQPGEGTAPSRREPLPDSERPRLDIDDEIEDMADTEVRAMVDRIFARYDDVRAEAERAMAGLEARAEAFGPAGRLAARGAAAGDTSLVPYFVERLRSADDPGDRIAAAEWLGEHGGEPALQALNAAASGDPDPEVAAACRRILGRED